MDKLKLIFSTKLKHILLFWLGCIVIVLFQGIAYSSINKTGDVVSEIPLEKYKVPELVFWGEDEDDDKQVGVQVSTSDSTSVIFFADDVVWAATQDSLAGWVLKFTDKGKYIVASP